MIKIENKIYVISKEESKWVLKFPKLNIETTAYIGKNGTTHNKKEGDGKTPIGEFKLGTVLRMHGDIKNKKCRQINKNMYWVDDSKSKYYNQLVDITQVKKDWISAEHLIDYPIEYEYLVEIKTNSNNIPEKGSAIFLHCSNNKPTAGCVAIDKAIMKKIIENIDEYTIIEIQKK